MVEDKAMKDKNIIPLNLLLLNNKLVRDVMFPISFGNDPDNLLELMSKTCKLIRWVITFGILPAISEKKQKIKMQSCEESCIYSELLLIS